MSAQILAFDSLVGCPCDKRSDLVYADQMTPVLRVRDSHPQCDVKERPLGPY